MEYEKLMEDGVNNLKVGTSVNLGNGRIVEFLGWVKSEKLTTRWKDGQSVTEYDDLVHCRDADGNERKWFPHVLRGGTVATMDATVVRCEYCEKLRPKNETKNARIRRNRAYVHLDFCKDEPCAGYYQMGCEG